MRRHVWLLAILMVAAAVRIWGIDFGFPHDLCRPDEDTVRDVALRIGSRNLNPHFFNYPTLLIYAVVALYTAYFNVGRLLGFFSAEWKFKAFALLVPWPFLLMGRSVAAACGVATVAVTYAAARRLFDRPTGLAAAALLALAALHVRDSHFGVTDVPAVLVTTASFLFAVRFVTTKKPGEFYRAAVCAGLAASTKYNAGLIIVVVFVAGALGASGSAAPIRSRLMDYVRAAALALAGFVAGTPFAVLDLRQFVADLSTESRHLLAGHTLDIGSGWYVHLTSSLRYGLTVPLLLAGVAGLSWMARRTPRKALLLAVFPLVYFLLIGGGRTAYARYILPLFPFLCISAAWLIVRAALIVTRTGVMKRHRSTCIAVLTAALVAPSTLTVFQVDRLLASTDSRVLAADWMRANVPGSASVYQSGSSFSQVQWRQPRTDTRDLQWAYWGGGAFTFRGQTVSAQPDVIVVEESPLPLYTPVRPGLDRVLAENYELAHRVRAYDPAARNGVYDQIDAFFVPMSGFRGIDRPGPNVSIYRRKASAR